LSFQIVLRRSLSVLVLAGSAAISGCGGAKVLKEAQPLQIAQPLANASERQVATTLDWVIVRDGPGTWAKNADWDEYLLRVTNLSDQPVQVTGVIVVDSLNTPIASQPGRKQLVKESKATVRRFKDSGMKIKAGSGAGTMLVAGAAVTTIGVTAASATAYAAAMSGAAAGATAGAAVGGLLLLGPALAVGGIVRGVNNSKVNQQIEERQTALPLEVPVGQELPLDIFFPLAPSPQVIEVRYTDASGEHMLAVDTREALRGLHMAPQDQS
jgi:hypothetical protein